MKKVIRILGCLLFPIVILQSCNKEGGQEYMESLSKNDRLHKTVKAGGIDYVFNVLTPEAMAWKDSYDPDRKVLDSMHYESRLKELKDYVFIQIDQKVSGKNISVLKYNLSSNNEYQSRVMYYEYKVGNDVKMECNGIQYPPSSYQYESHLNLSPVNSMIMAFPACREAGVFSITLNDRALGNLLLKAQFDQKDIQELPKVVLNR